MKTGPRSRFFCFCAIADARPVNITTAIKHMRPLRGQWIFSFVFYTHVTPLGSGKTKIMNLPLTLRSINMLMQRQTTPPGSHVYRKSHHAIPTPAGSQVFEKLPPHP